MDFGWCNLSLEDWDYLSVDEWFNLPICPTFKSPQPVTIRKGAMPWDGFLDYPFVDAIPTGERTPHSVLLDRGAFIFRLDLLNIPSLAGLAWRFGLNYQHVQPGVSQDRESILGPCFEFPQNNVIVQDPEDPDQAGLSTGNKMLVTFPLAGGDTAAGTFTRTGSGVDEQYELSNSEGAATTFFGLDAAIDTPGCMKQIKDRYGNSMSYTWETHVTVPRRPISRLTEVTDGYGRKIYYRYTSTGSDPQIVQDGYRLTEIEDVMGRKLNFQYDTDGRLVAVVCPSITKGANGDTDVFANGTAYVFAYDSSGRLEKIWYPNQCAAHVGAGRVVDVSAVVNQAAPRYTVVYDTANRVSAEAVGDATAGGTYHYSYDFTGPFPTNEVDANDPIVSMTTVTDRNGNISYHYFNANGMPVLIRALTNRNKLNLQSGPYDTWTKYNPDNQPLLIRNPLQNTSEHEYDDGVVNASFTHLKRRGLPIRQTAMIPAGGAQEKITVTTFYEPLFNQVCATVDPRGNPIDGSSYFPPQNSGLATADRYATLTYYDYQKDTLANVKAAPDIQTSVFGATPPANAADLIETLINNASTVLTSAGLPSFGMALGDINGDGETSGVNVRKGSAIKNHYPTAQTIDGSQTREEVVTVNNKGQITSRTDSAGNISAIVRHPDNMPDGVHYTGAGGTGQYGFVSKSHSNINPADVKTTVQDVATF